MEIFAGRTPGIGERNIYTKRKQVMLFENGFLSNQTIDGKAKRSITKTFLL
jgi:hypothetical protein